ncbi:hypothetical protein DBT_2289 [Dissulfuribacter thermophilus]|uniref:Potassium channel domain-containing protein n=1 Tax=Dissulfuribacter thermophilus TaxID=1156395 RepID=A0A1B9F304_9BACT|nr:pentapeptide repeat-containing protein [Dissulfuribacter thermophilus]OCC14300.1 hypothetical protein DBT_2289 [Dissulfuribacter thermophilus]
MKPKEIADYIKEHKSLPPGINNLEGLNLEGIDLSGADLSRANLSKADLRDANLRDTIFFKADLSEALFNGADISGADFTGADLSQAHFNSVKAHAVGFGAAKLNGATFFEADLQSSSFTKAELVGVDFRCADMSACRLREADLRKADFTSSVLNYADLSMANVAGARFDNADIRHSKVIAITGYEKASWIGTDIRDINFAGGYQLRRFIVDQNYLKEFREKNLMCHIIYWIWYITSDCGRSMTRWMLWVTALTLFFAWLYTVVGVDYGDYPTPISPLYFSVVTLTTLGYGDVVPKTITGQLVAMIEVITGYLMLGGLLSIFSNKMARRAE